MMDRLTREQIKRNQAADDAWLLYAPHRERVTRLLLNAASVSSERLCLLGAGNLNDVSLTSLLSAFGEIVLLDVDGEALRRGVSRQGYDGHPRIRVLAPFDLTGCFHELSQCENSPQFSSEVLENCLALLRRIPDSTLVGPCDVVGSVGVLTQLIDGVVRSIGESHPRYWEVVSTIRDQHLRLLLEATKPGGAAVLVTEVLSSDTCPELPDTPESGLLPLLRREIEARNFFTGTNPAALEHALRTEEPLVRQIESAKFSDPWLWTFTARVYAVFAITLRKRR